jgi:uncharacterized membrane protein
MKAKQSKSSGHEGALGRADVRRRAARLRAYRLGVLVFVALALLTTLEFVIALALHGSIGLLLISGVAKAALIVFFYMHIKSLWSKEAHG